MAAIEALEDIKELNARHSDIEIEHMLNQKREEAKQYALLKKQLEEEEDEAEIQYVVDIFLQLNWIFLVLSRKVFGKPSVKIDQDDVETEEVKEQIEEIIPLSVDTIKPKVGLIYNILQTILLFLFF